MRIVFGDKSAAVAAVGWSGVVAMSLQTRARVVSVVRGVGATQQKKGGGCCGRGRRGAAGMKGSCREQPGSSEQINNLKRKVRQGEALTRVGLFTREEGAFV